MLQPETLSLPQLSSISESNPQTTVFLLETLERLREYLCTPRYLRPPLSVHHLSLSSLHWLPPSLLTATISRLTSLTHLNIADLRITPGHLTTLLSSLPLTHLAFTWSWSEAKVGNRWGKVAAHLARLQEVKVHLATSAEARCPLDHLTHLLALATNLTRLAVFTPTIPSNATTNTARYNVTTNFRPMVLSKLRSLVLVLANRTYPVLVVRQFLDLVTSATPRRPSRVLDL